MKNFSEIIVYFWFIPVVIQIILPLGIFVSWLIIKLIALTFPKQNVAMPATPLQEY